MRGCDPAAKRRPACVDLPHPGGWAKPLWTFAASCAISPTYPIDEVRTHVVSAALSDLVEQPDPEHPGLDQALRRKGGRGRSGNVYYQSAGGKRRWVIYNGEAEASRISPDWHGWLHHTYREPPTQAPLARKPWEKPHEPNQTGTPGAYHPAGSLYRAKPVERRDYDAWQPE